MKVKKIISAIMLLFITIIGCIAFASCKEKTVTYKIEFVNGEEVLQTLTVNAGELPEYTGKTPEKASNAEFVFTFEGWDKDIVAASEDTTYTAVFGSRKNKYKVMFCNHDGKEIQSEELSYGKLPEFKGDEPVKESTEQFCYIFEGWDKEITVVTGNVIYTAKYKESLRSYTIIFADEDGSILQTKEIEYGKLPEYVGMPTKIGALNTIYKFIGWDKEVTSVTKNKTYTAMYKEYVGKTLTSLKDSPVFKKDEIQDGKILLTLNIEDSLFEIEEIDGAKAFNIVSGQVEVTLNDDACGENVLTIFSSSGKMYIYSLVIADEIITSAVEFNAMLEERVIKNNALDPKYYALTNDIRIADTKIITPSGRDHGNYNYEFKDTFDGRGHMISANDSEKTIWNNGMFGNVTGGTVKNLIVKDIMVRYTSERAGAIANTVQSGGVIENVVVINPIMRSQNGNNGLSFGMLVGNIYGDSIIRNCLVVDLNSFNGTNPQKSSPGDYAEGKYVGSILFNGIAGIMGGSFNADNAIDNYCITASENIFGARSSASAGTDAMPGTVLSSMQIFVETVGSKVQYYKLLNVEANGDITVGGIKIYSAS